MSVPVADEGYEGEASSLWLLTFADLTAILVALFVLMYSMSTPLTNHGNGETASGAATSRLSTTDRTVNNGSAQVDPLADLTIGYLSAVLSDRDIVPMSEGGDHPGPVTQAIEGNRLVLHIASDFAFSGGESALQPAALGLLSDLAVVLSNVSNPVSVFVPVPENLWALAFERADSVVSGFRQFGYAAPVERFVTPGMSADAVVIVIGRAGGNGL